MASMFKVRASDGGVIWWTYRYLRPPTREVLIASGDIYEIAHFTANPNSGAFAFQDDLGPDYETLFESAATAERSTRYPSVIDSTGNYLWSLGATGSTGNQSKWNRTTGQFVSEGQATFANGTAASRPSRYCLGANSTGGITTIGLGSSPRWYATNSSGVVTNSTSAPAYISSPAFFDYSTDYFLTSLGDGENSRKIQIRDKLITSRVIATVDTKISTLAYEAYLLDANSAGDVGAIVARRVRRYDSNLAQEFDVALTGSTSVETGTTTPVALLCGSDDSVIVSARSNGYGSLAVTKYNSAGVVWDRELGKPYGVSNGIYDMREIDGAIYVSGQWESIESTRHCQLASIDAGTGDLNWERRLVIGTLGSDGWGFAHFDGYLFVACNGKVKIG